MSSSSLSRRALLSVFAATPLVTTGIGVFPATARAQAAEAGADLEARTDEGMTPAMLGTIHGRAESLRVLLDLGARLVFDRVLRGHATEILIQPSGISGFAPDTWWHARADRRNGLFELEKYLYYRVMYLLRLTP